MISKLCKISWSCTFITLLAIPFILLSLETACSQDQHTANISKILSQISSDALTVDLMEKALPRINEDTIIFKLRGGDANVLRGGDLTRENNFKKCLIIGAYFTAAQWEWQQFMRKNRTQTEIDKLKFAIEDYLININHRLKHIQAPKRLLKQIDSTKANFAASEKELKGSDLKPTTEMLEKIATQLKAFMLTQQKYDISFKMGEWLVWQAELANLCLRAYGQNAEYLRGVMNQTYRSVNWEQFKSLSKEIVMAEVKQESDELSETLVKLNSRFLVQNQNDVIHVQTEVENVFNIFELRFPGLKIY